MWPFMYDKAYIKILFNQIYTALIKIKERTATIHSAEDFTNKEGEEKLDSICILFMAIGENLKSITITLNFNDKHCIFPISSSMKILSCV